MLSKWRLLQIWFLAGAVLAIIFSAAFFWLWSAAKEYGVSSLEKQITTTLSNELAEGNILKLEAALGKSQKEGILQFAEIRQFVRPDSWETIYKTQFLGSPAVDPFTGFTCSSGRLVKPHFWRGVGLLVVLPGNISGADCLALYIDSDLPHGLKILRNRLILFAIFSAAALVGLFFIYMTSWHKKIVLLETENLKAHIDKQASLTALAAQVAHDIRSPLFALDAALKDTAELPEKKRIIVRHAVNRIRDVANDLLEKNRQQTKTVPAADSAGEKSEAGVILQTYLISSIVDPIITEKRLQFESKPGINIDFELTRESYGLFAKIQPVEFRRMISNLVNNAVEALGDKGAVIISLGHENESIILTVSDNGKGILPEILARLGQKGETHGKAGGSGLGLFHARTTAESWGGSLTITSEPGKGSKVTIKLPKAEAPDEFVPELILYPGRPVVVLDDDPSVHQIWQGRFESVRVKEHDIEVLHFSEPDKLRTWVKANQIKVENAVCLFDYELSGYKETGLSLSEELGLCGQTILVTSRCEEDRIIAECRRLKIRMIPKGLSGFVPMTIGDSKSLINPPVSASSSKCVVLVDDDALTHMTWEMAAQEHGIKLQAYTDPAEFLSQLGDFPKDTPIYIDSDLGENIKGEDIAADLRKKGFTNLCLATGHPPEKFSHLPWLKVISKEPPWG